MSLQDNLNAMNEKGSATFDKWAARAQESFNAGKEKLSTAYDKWSYARETAATKKPTSFRSMTGTVVDPATPLGRTTAPVTGIGQDAASAAQRTGSTGRLAGAAKTISSLPGVSTAYNTISRAATSYGAPVLAGYDVLNAVKNPSALGALKAGSSTLAAASKNPATAVGAGAFRTGLELGDQAARAIVPNFVSETNPATALTPEGEKYRSLLDAKPKPVAPAVAPTGDSAIKMEGTIPAAAPETPIAPAAPAPTLQAAKPEVIRASDRNSLAIQPIRTTRGEWGANSNSGNPALDAANYLMKGGLRERVAAANLMGNLATSTTTANNAAATNSRLLKEADKKDVADFISSADSQFVTPENKPDLAAAAAFRQFMRQNLPKFPAANGVGVDEIYKLDPAVREQLKAELLASYRESKNADASVNAQWIGAPGNSEEALQMGAPVRNSDGTVTYDETSKAAEPFRVNLLNAMDYIGEDGVGFLPLYGGLPYVDNRVVRTNRGLVPARDIIGEGPGAADREAKIARLGRAVRN